MGCATGGTIVSGAMAERTQLKGFIIYVIAMTTIIYPIVVYWGWSGSGFLNYVDEDCDAQYIALGGCSIVGPKLYDFAGSGIVHMVGGVAALCGSAIVGPRNGRFDDNAGESFDAHNMPFTVFAPTNDGFAALPEGTVDTLLKPENKDQLVDILTYHVLGSEVLSTDLKFFQRVKTVEGKNVSVYKTRKGVFVSPDGKDFKTVVGADNKASNGVAHIIDGVLIPPASGLSDALPNIVELAQSVPDLSTLVAAVVAGDLVDTLTSPGPFTVFAPTNDGFAALPEGTLDTLLKPENKDTLVDILTFHVLPSQVLSTDLKYFQRVATVEGKSVHVYKTRKGV